VPAPFLFIGVVSHEGSRYSTSQGPSGLAAALSTSLMEAGVATEVVVDTSNRLQTSLNPVSSEDVQDALSAQVRLEDEWNVYLSGSRLSGLRAAGDSTLRWGRRLWRKFAPPSTSMVERLLNIEMAHVALWAQGLSSGAPWILILEDDASADDLVDLSIGLVELLNGSPDGVQFINVSESFDVSKLGINHLLSATDIDWAGSVTRRVVSASRPVTNTVCAIVYRASFVAELLREFSSMPMRPVVPIDWKLNKALMSMNASGALGADSCWWVVPGPIDQLSMRGDS